MSRQFCATLPADCAPERAALERALKRAGRDLQLDPAWDDPTHRGYLPCTLRGEDAGFDMQRSHGSEGLRIEMRCGGDARERAAALSVMRVLAGSFGAQLTDDADAMALEEQEQQAWAALD